MGLRSIPPHVSAPNRPPFASTPWIWRNAPAGSTVNIKPMRHATTSNDPFGRSMAAASRTAVSTLVRSRLRRVAASTMPGATSLSTTRPLGPTACDQMAPRLPGPAASSSTRSPAFTATASTSASVAAVEWLST